MKKNDDLKNLSIDELTEKKRKLKGMLLGIAIPMILACFALFYTAIKTKNYALIAVASGCSITLLPAFVSITAIENEIKKRSQDTISD